MTLDPTTAYQQQPQPAQQQDMPGETGRMTPRPDHGETSYRGSGRLLDRVAIITGADSGIGRAVAIAFAREGADVLVSYYNEEEDARETGRWVEEAGRRALLVSGDIKDEAHCRKLVERAREAFGRIDILVNNAAHQATIASIEEISSEEWDVTMRTNLYAMFFLCKAAVPLMRPGSAIINTTSIQSKSPSGNLLAYAATTGAIANFTAGLAELVAERGIRVNAVAPGFTITDMTADMADTEAGRARLRDMPLGRFGRADEVADAVIFLLTDDASLFLGQTLNPNAGGYMP
jgi:NAD(P)-dependent dehydrogenase (short-subunit alcohol dehydrogenase family)